MKLVVTDSGKQVLLFWGMCSINTDTFEDWWLELFTNDETVTDDSVTPDFTLATFGGYDHVSITREDFRFPIIEDHIAVTQREEETVFNCTGAPNQTVYGWIMVGKDSGETLAGQNFDTPHLMSAGAELSVDPFNFKLKKFE